MKRIIFTAMVLFSTNALALNVDCMGHTKMGQVMDYKHFPLEKVGEALKFVYEQKSELYRNNDGQTGKQIDWVVPYKVTTAVTDLGECV